MHSKARLKKLKLVSCWRIDVELYKNFYAKLGVQIWTIWTRLAKNRNYVLQSVNINGKIAEKKYK